MLEILAKGGLLMIPILFCSIIGLAIIIERLYVFHRSRVHSERFMERLMRLIKEKMIREAIALCDESKSPLALTVKAGITKSEKGREEIERAMEEASRGVISELERYLNGLAIIAHVSPLLGLLGTVTGMIKAFMKVEQAGGNVNVGVLAGGIWEALITTASGLVVAIPMIVAHHYLTGKVNSISQDLEIQAAQVVEGLTSEERKKEG